MHSSQTLAGDSRLQGQRQRTAYLLTEVALAKHSRSSDYPQSSAEIEVIHIHAAEIVSLGHLNL